MRKIAAALLLALVASAASAQRVPGREPAETIPAPVGGQWQYRLSDAAQIAIADENEKQERSNRLSPEFKRPITAIRAPCAAGELVVILQFGTISGAFDQAGIAHLAIHKVGQPGSLGTATIKREDMTPSDEMTRRRRLTVDSVDSQAKAAGVDPAKTPEITACG